MIEQDDSRRSKVPGGRRNFVCAVSYASFVLRSLVGDHQIENLQSRGAAIEFRDRLLRDLEAAMVKSENR